MKQWWLGKVQEIYEKSVFIQINQLFILSLQPFQKNLIRYLFTIFSCFDNCPKLDLNEHYSITKFLS